MQNTQGILWLALLQLYISINSPFFFLKFGFITISFRRYISSELILFKSPIDYHPRKEPSTTTQRRSFVPYWRSSHAAWQVLRRSTLPTPPKRPFQLYSASSSVLCPGESWTYSSYTNHRPLSLVYTKCGSTRTLRTHWCWLITSNYTDRTEFLKKKWLELVWQNENSS